MSSVTTSIKQNTSKQDFIKSGSAIDENNIEYDYIVLADGHGSRINKDIVIDFIRNYDWDTKLKYKNWYKTFTIEFEEIVPKSGGSGSTLSVVRIYKDIFECWWIGDSSIRLYENSEEIWKSLDHDACNRQEHAKLIKKGYNLKSEHKPYVLTPTSITMVPSYRIIMASQDKIAMTRCLGHKNMTGNEIEFAVIPRNTDSRYKLVVGSDGLWDLVCNTDTSFLASEDTDAKILMEWIYCRWLQEWMYVHISGNQKITFPNWNRDDICIGVFTS
jgi:serine/threonine protein phosphatase PrpC